jgi:DNA mismatch repair protein MutS
LTNVANAQVLVQETGEELLFLHRVVHGGAWRSYDIEANSHVAVGLAPQG